MSTKQTTDSKALLWAAVERWSVAKYGKINLSRLATDSGIGLGTAARLKDMDVTIGIDKVQAIAESFGLPIWQFLDPSVTPYSPATTFSPQAAEIARAFDRLTDPAAQRMAYATATQIIEFARKPVDHVPSVP